MTIDAREIAEMLYTRGYTWNVGGILACPSTDDVESVIEHSHAVLDSDPTDELQLEIGHLIFKKRAGFIDVFLHVGSQKLGETND